MWAHRGWRFERPRVQENIKYLARYVDFVRYLGQVDWPGNDINPADGDYASAMAELIDWTWDACGLRTQLSLFGSRYSANAVELADRIADIVAPRAEKVIFVEGGNEWWQNFGDEERLGQVCRRLRERLANLVAFSAPQEELATDRTKEWVRAGLATAGTAHFDRAWKEGGWGHIRKPWESRGPGWPSSHNEPGGPRSSVREYTDPLQLAMARVTGIVCQYDAYVLHNGAGVAGRVDPARNRPANVWEVPGIDDIMAAVRGVERFLPADASTGQPTRKGLGPHPLSSDMYWQDNPGFDHGCVRDYANVCGDHFVEVLLGIKNYVKLRADAGYDLTVVDPLTGPARDVIVGGGEEVKLDPVSRDAGGLGGLIVIGHRR